MPSQEGDDPRTEPIPELDLVDPAKSTTVEVTFNGPDNVQVESIEVVRQRAPHPGAHPPMLQVEILDRHGAVVEQFNEWNPLEIRVYNVSDPSGHSIQMADTATMTIAVPFNPDHSRLLIRDLEREGRQLVDVDLEEAIRDFCETAPDDVDCRLVDLAITDIAVLDPPTQVLPGDSASFTVQTVLANNGPSTPVDALVTKTAAATAGAEIAPTSSMEELRLEIDTPQLSDQTYTVTCTQRGLQTITFTSTIEPARPADVDTASDNDQLSVELHIRCGAKDQ